MGLPTPNTRKEQYLNAIATGNTGGLPTPITREEEYLDAIAKSGGGGGEGDMKKSVYDSDLAVANAGGISAFVSDAVSGKVDKVAGKGLSTNDYSDTEKGKVTANAEAIEAMVNVNGAKNVLPNNGVTNTSHGITYTVNDDKSVTISNIQDNTWGALFLADSAHSFILKRGEWTLTQNETDTINNGLYIAVRKVSDNSDVITTEYHNPKTVTINTDVEVYALIVVKPFADFTTPVTVYPMIRDARITDDTYVPYAMTNRELTDGLNNLTSVHGLLYDTDLNNITEAGLYILATGNTNKPDNMADWSGMLCCTDSESGFQLVFSRSGYMYWRFQVSGNWENWVYINHV